MVFVKLIGYCIEDDQRLLVYEFMTRGSLEDKWLSQDSLLTFLFLFNFFYGLCQTYWVLH
jgi:hypothetical protein